MNSRLPTICRRTSRREGARVGTGGDGIGRLQIRNGVTQYVEGWAGTVRAGLGVRKSLAGAVVITTWNELLRVDSGDCMRSQIAMAADDLLPLFSVIDGRRCPREKPLKTYAQGASRPEQRSLEILYPGTRGLGAQRMGSAIWHTAHRAKGLQKPLLRPHNGGYHHSFRPGAR